MSHTIKTQVKKCVVCGGAYIKKVNESSKSWDKRLYCGKKCWYDRSKGERECPVCKKIFQVSGTHNRKFCSKECCVIAHPPPKQGTITPKTCEHCGKEYFRKGAKARAESKYCSHECSIAAHKGDGHWNWKDGVTPELHRLRNTAEYHEWRLAVYERDYWTCQHCGKKERDDIVAHHIKSFNDFPDLRHDVDNGITLCRSCHKKVHSEIGEKTRFK